MRVGILAHNHLTKVAGGTRFLVVLSNVLKDAGFEVAYACTDINVELVKKKFGGEFDFPIYKPKRIWVGDRLGPFYIGEINTLITYLPSISKLCREYKPNVVIGIEPLTCFIPPILLGIPTIYHCTAPTTWYFKTDYAKYQGIPIQSFTGIHRILSRPYITLEEMIAKRITAICYTSKWTKNNLPPPFNKDSVVISNPVDIELFKPNTKKENAILCVLRFIKESQYDKMIDAFKKVGRNDFTLHLAGGLSTDVPEYVHLYHQLEEKIKTEKIENVKLHPNADFSTILNLYKTAKIFWYPNPAQFGIVIIEAQSCGVVPICRDTYRTGPSEIVTNGVNGFIVNNFEEMVERTKMLLENENKLKQMGAEARKNAVEHHSVEIFKKKFVDLIEEAVRK